jgi:DNA invertase Pin-like site-specific DNA recombinase
MRAAIYCRFSSDQQKLTSLADQERICRQYVEQQGWTTIKVYSDAAISGSHDDRPSYQQMLNDARAGKFEVLVAEDLDRLNRRLEHTANLYSRLQFVGIEIHTISHGKVGDLHVGISGLLGEMFIKNLSQKTRRGIEGRVRAGKSGGGLCYGYEVVVGEDAGGQPLTGERKVNEAQAAVVREIFRRFAAGDGPRAIARALNERGVPGPYARPWGDTTIRGHAKKGTGLLNNQLYRGRQVWGRQRFIKNPETGRRVSRLNAAGSEVVIEVPHLRIVDEELWEAVKRRQAMVSRPLTDPHTTTPLNDLHRPRFLLSGLLTCGVCGGGFTITAKDRYGCARRGRQGTCSNSRGIKRLDLERRVLDGLRSSLVTPDLVAEFVAEYQTEWNRLQGERRAAASQRDRQLANVQRRLAGIVEAIERGIITPTTKQRLEELEAEKASLEVFPVEAPLPAIHPNLARLYREKVTRLEEELADPEIAAEAKSVLRSLIKTIKVTPGAKRGDVTLELHGELAAILAAGQVKRNKDGTLVAPIQVSVVAGARNRLDLQLKGLLSASL